MLSNFKQEWIIHQDEDIVVINKPAGVLSVADGYNSELPYLRTILEPEFGRLFIVHRLDKDTSGVIVLARNEIAHRFLNLQFDQRTIRKKYSALILGSPPWNEYSINLPVTINGDKAHRTRIFPGRGKPSQTDILLIKGWKTAAHISAVPHTGYTHQIRAHLSTIGYPILFDKLYTPPEKKPLATDFIISTRIDPSIQRTMLHASEINFTHPESGKFNHFQAPLPDDMLCVIDILNI